jgi:2,5-furandicarboxylate decarboxylase 1
MKEEPPELRTYLTRLKEKGQLVEVTEEVSTKFEVASLEKALDGHKALIVKPKEGRFKIVANVLISRDRFAEAVGRSRASFEGFLLSSMEKASKPRTVDQGAFHHEEHSAGARVLPIVHHYEKDSGPFITASMVVARNMETKSQNLSFHRLLKLDDLHFAVRMVEGRHLHRAYTLAKESGRDLPVAVVVGAHPAVEMAASYQAPYGFDELTLANALLGGRLEVVEVDGGLFVPAHSEIVMVGVIRKEKLARERMVEMLGNYDIEREQPVMELHRVYSRREALYRDILPGGREHRMLMSYPVEVKLNKAVKDVVPSTRRVVLTEGGCNWLHAVIQINKRLEGEPKNALLAAFAAHPSLKMATVVDDDIDPGDPLQVEYALATRFQASRGLMVIRRAKGSSLDPSADQEALLTDKVGMDATMTLRKPKERFEIAVIPNYEETVRRFLRGRT